MDSEILKKILKDDSEKLIIMDGGKPKFVVMSYPQYLKLAEKNNYDANLEMNFGVFALLPRITICLVLLRCSIQETVIKKLLFNPKQSEKERAYPKR